ncbi:MAG: LysR family transcriptional regulator [Candidatus Spyradocola sp.]|jgi:DNA-binding transcriptional LysR family regulator
MDFRQLTYFVTAVEEGSISAAARKLFLSQPPVTAQIKALEEELGCALLVRGARSVRMTEEGRLLYDRAKAMLALRDGAEEEILSRVHSGGGTLRLGVVSSVAGSLLPEWLAAFHEERPLIRFALSEENTYHLLDGLRNGLSEAALVRTPFAAEGLETLPLLREELVAAGRRELLPEGEDVRLAELARRPLLLYRRWEHIALRLFAERGLSPQILLKGDGADTIAALAARGLGIGLLPQSAVRALSGADFAVRRIEGGAIRTTVTAVRLARAEPSPAAQAFWEFLARRAEPDAQESAPAGKDRA